MNVFDIGEPARSPDVVCLHRGMTAGAGGQGEGGLPHIAQIKGSIRLERRDKRLSPGGQGSPRKKFFISGTTVTHRLLVRGACFPMPAS